MKKSRVKIWGDQHLQAEHILPIPALPLKGGYRVEIFNGKKRKIFVEYRKLSSTS
jgi:hypothetical protein